MTPILFNIVSSHEKKPGDWQDEDLVFVSH